MSFHSGSIYLIVDNYFFNPVQPPLLFQPYQLLMIITMSNLPIIPSLPIIRDSRVCDVLRELTKACDFTKSNTPFWVFFSVLELCKWYRKASHKICIPTQ